MLPPEGGSDALEDLSCSIVTDQSESRLLTGTGSEE